tara:strand:- start:964 stop:2703 length:1740 start_codon:yes stop_codon:yes gene_type:complete
MAKSPTILPICKLAIGVSLLIHGSTEVSGQTRPTGIPEGALHFNSHWYEVATAEDGIPQATRMTWSEACEFALERGGHLACIETREELAFIMQASDHRPDITFWLGGYAGLKPQAKQTHWCWVNGQPVDKVAIGVRASMGLETRMILLKAVRGKGRTVAVRDDAKRSVNGFIIEYPASDFTLTQPEVSTPPDAPPNPEVSAPPDAPPSIRRNQTMVNGLLVMAVGSGQAGSASPMTLIALPSEPEKPASISFNQEVGSSMQTALEEVTKFITLRYDAWPKGRDLEISFENKYNPKDGPSAAVACALLLESAISGNELDPGFAVTGDMNADGSVQPIGGVEAKVRGATNRDCTHIAVPFKNVTAIYDTVLMNGVKPVMDIQVFSISDFEEAYAIALAHKSEAVRQAIDDFASIQTLYLNRTGSFTTTLKHPKVIEKLSSIVEAAPNHVSASLLLAYSQGRGPKTLSLHGSFSFIDQNTYQIVNVIKGGKVSELESFDEDQVAEAISLLRRSKLKLDKRTWQWADSLLRWGELMREYQTNRPKAISNVNKLVREINTAGNSARAERTSLLENPEVMEELLE